MLLQKEAGVRVGFFADLFGGTLGHYFSAFVATLRPEVDNVIGKFYAVELMSDDDDGMAGVDQTLEAVESFLAIGQV